MSCPLEPLFLTLQLSHETSEASYRSGVLQLNHQQQRHIKELNQQLICQQGLRTKQSNASVWERVNSFVSSIFIAIGLVAGIAAAGVSSPLVAVALITAAVWRIGAEVVRALNLKQKILDALVPQGLSRREEICQVLETGASVTDLVANLILAIGTARVGAQLIGGGLKTIFQIASTTVTAGLATTSAIKQAQVRSLKGELVNYEAMRLRLEREIAVTRSDLHAQMQKLEQHAKFNGFALESDHQAKESLLIES